MSKEIVVSQMFSAEEVNTLKEAYCRDASDSEFKVFVYICERMQLNPFKKQIYFSKIGGKMTTITGIDGLRLIAERTGRYVPGKDTAFAYTKEGNLYSATSYVKKFGPDKTWHEVAATAIYSEYRANGGVWQSKPHVMLAKCLPYRARIQTDIGTFSIGDIVKNKMNVNVRSINLTTGLEEWKPITGWFRNDGTQIWQRITVPNKTHGNRPIITTPEHQVYTENGWKEAHKIKVGEKVAVASSLPSEDQKQILIGSLFGDGTVLSQKNRNGCPHFSEAHSTKQLEYLAWKARNLSTFDPVLRFYRVYVKGEDHEVVKLCTKSSPYLYNLSNEFYKKRKKIISRESLNKLNDLGVAIWIMDDGSVKKTGRGDHCNPFIRLYACCFGNQSEIIRFFETRYMVSPKCLREEGNPYLVFNAADTKKLLDALSGYIAFDAESNDKKWIAKDVEQGVDHSFCFVPCLRNELYDRGEKEGKYDITVQDNHNFLYNNILIHNCAEAQALRKAFPSDLSGLYAEEELDQAESLPRA